MHGGFQTPQEISTPNVIFLVKDKSNKEKTMIPTTTIFFFKWLMKICYDKQTNLSTFIINNLV